jgi:hypothetical protein
MRGKDRKPADAPAQRAARRLFWVFMLVLHSLALPSLFASAASATLTEQLALVPRVAGLAASAIFFVLKFLDVPWLRMRGDWRCLVAAVLVIGLLHVGVIDRAIAGPTGTDPSQMPWLVVGAVLGTALLIRRLLDDLAVRLPSTVPEFLSVHAFAGAVRRAWRPHEVNSHVLYAAQRAPPVA